MAYIIYLYMVYEFLTTRYAMMPEVALDPKREFRRSMSDFKPGEIIPVLFPFADSLRMSATMQKVCPNDIASFGF